MSSCGQKRSLSWEMGLQSRALEKYKAASKEQCRWSPPLYFLETSFYIVAEAIKEAHRNRKERATRPTVLEPAFLIEMLLYGCSSSFGWQGIQGRGPENAIKTQCCKMVGHHLLHHLQSTCYTTASPILPPSVSLNTLSQANNSTSAHLFLHSTSREL